MLSPALGADHVAARFITLLGGAVATNWFGQPSAAQAQSALRCFGSATSTLLRSSFSPVRLAAFSSAASSGTGMNLKNLVLELRGAAGRTETLPKLVQELLDAKVDLIFATGYPPRGSERRVYGRDSAFHATVAQRPSSPN